MTSSVPWPTICTVRRNMRLTKFARRSASQGRRFTSMSRRLASCDDRSGTRSAESANSALYCSGVSVPARFGRSDRRSASGPLTNASTSIWAKSIPVLSRDRPPGDRDRSFASRGATTPLRGDGPWPDDLGSLALRPRSDRRTMLEHARSGLSIAAFCRREDLTPWTFRWSRRKWPDAVVTPRPMGRTRLRAPAPTWSSAPPSCRC